MPAGTARRHLPARNGELPPPIFEAETGEAPRHLRDYLSVLHKYRWLAIACFGVTVGLTILVTLLTPRLYTASTRLQVARQSPIQLRLDGNVIRVPDGDRDANGVMTFVSAQAAALKSRDLAERVIREHGLATNEAFLDPRPRRRGLGALADALPRLVRPRGLEGAPAGSAAREAGSATSAATERSDAQSRYKFLGEKPHGDLLAYFLDRPGLQKLHLALLDIREQRAGLEGRLGPRHPQVQELRRQQAEIEAQLRAEVEQEVEAIRTRYDAAKLSEDDLRGKLDELGVKAIELRDLGARYQLLKNNVDSAHGLHASLLKQRMDTGVNAALVASNVPVIERAEAPLRPSKPTVPLNLTLRVLAGLVLAVGAAFSFEYFDQSVKSSGEVEDLLQVPTLATIPNFEQARRATVRGPHARRLLAALDGNGRAASNGHGTTDTGDGHDDLVILQEPWSQVAEAFRSLRTAVLFTARGAPPKVIVVTSAVAAEGKTVGSLNLATALAETGSRVLLLEADLRHPRCHRTLGVNADRGLSSVLDGQEELESVIHALDAPPLFFVPAGSLPRNPADLVSSPRMRQALERLRSQ